MIDRRTVIASGLVAAVLAFGTAHAAPAAMPFTQAAFEAAQKSGKPILVEIHADWCPTCKAQEPIISQLRNDPRFKDLVVFRVDYDGQKDVVKRFNARSHSTLIAFKGTAEAGRSVGDTNKASITALLGKTV